MPIKFDAEVLETLASTIRQQQATLIGQVKSLVHVAQRDPSGWDGSSGARYDSHLSDFSSAQDQLDHAMTSMASVIDSMAAHIRDLDSQALGH